MDKLNYQWSVIGQEKKLLIIDKAIKEKNFAHAYLFCGPQGLGKSKIALNFAQILQCESNKNKPCGKCINCQKIIKNQNPDVFIIKNNNSITIQEIRNLKEKLITKPYKALYKVVLIIEAQKMTLEAQNAFLKILEEPPKDTLIILTCENKEQLLPTIVSRCQIINFTSVSINSIRKELIKRGIEKQKVEELTRLSMGRPEFVISLLDNSNLLILREKFISDIYQLIGQGIVEKFKYAEKISKEDLEKNKFFLDILISWFRDLFLIKINAEEKIINFKHLSMLKKQSSYYNFDNLKEILSQLIKLKKYSSYYSNWRLLWELIFIIID